MKKLLLGIIAILFSFNGWAETLNFKCDISRSGETIYLSVNKDTNKGSVREKAGDGNWYNMQADVDFTPDTAIWSYIHYLGYSSTWEMDRESLGLYSPNGTGKFWTHCEIQKDNPKNKF